MCDVLIYSHEEGIAKPDSRFYQLVCDRLGVAPHETIFLDDKLPCVHGARAIGMHAVQFVSNERALAELSLIIENASRRL
jgi:putative hydrolase of the HAD superfamily